MGIEIGPFNDFESGKLEIEKSNYKSLLQKLDPKIALELAKAIAKEKNKQLSDESFISPKVFLITEIEAARSISELQIFEKNLKNIETPEE